MFKIIVNGDHNFTGKITIRTSLRNIFINLEDGVPVGINKGDVAVLKAAKKEAVEGYNQGKSICTLKEYEDIYGEGSKPAKKKPTKKKKVAKKKVAKKEITNL